MVQVQVLCVHTYVRTYMYLICTHIWDAIACTQHTDVVVTVISPPVCLQSLQSLGQLSLLATKADVPLCLK